MLDPKPATKAELTKFEKPEPEKTQPARIREYFPETLFWQPQLVAGQGTCRPGQPVGGEDPDGGEEAGRLVRCGAPSICAMV